MQHPFRGMTELTAAGVRRHVRGGDMGLQICVEFISQSNLKPSTPKLARKLLKYPFGITLSILTGKESLDRCLATELLALIASGLRASAHLHVFGSVSYCCVGCVKTDLQIWDLHQEVSGLSLC